VKTVARTLETLAPGKARLAYDYLNERISDGTFPPGYRLVLGSIANQIGVSTVPVREAIRMLEAEGAVTFERNVGAQVSGLNPELFSQTLESLAVLGGYATASAAPHMTPADLAEARQITESMRQAIDALDAVAFMDLNARFHRVLYRRCPNAHLLELVERTRLRLTQVRHSTLGFVPEHARASLAEHEQQIDLVESGAPGAEIEASIREHHLATLRAARPR